MVFSPIIGHQRKRETISLLFEESRLTLSIMAFPLTQEFKSILQLTMFERTTRSFGAIIVMSKVALIAGSSQHGNALLASVA